MKTLNRQATLQKIRAKQDAIHYESDDDEAAQEYYAELQSIKNMITHHGFSDEEIITEAEGLSESSLLVYL